MEKKCNTCEQIKDIQSFRVTYNTLKDGSQSPTTRGTCRDCERDKSRANTFKYTRGITHEERDELLVKQGGECACCGTCVPGSAKGWHVDHCHSSGKIRGVLCANCNIALGQVNDSVYHLLQLIDYLNKHGHC